jgi:Salt stress response/antifungal
MACYSCRNDYLPLFLFWLLCMKFIWVAYAEDTNPLDCPTDSNFTVNSTYQSNLGHLLSALPTSGAPTGFTVATYGDAPDQVFGRVLCRGDASSSECLSCLTTAAQSIRNRCPVGKRAMAFYDKCFLRYSDSNSTTYDENLWNYILYNIGTISDAEAFDELYNDLMGGLAVKAANSSRKFAMGQANFTSAITMYGLVECMRDLSGAECLMCLNQSMGYFQACCWKNQGGVVLRYQCYIRMEIYQYFENTSLEEPSPPPPPLSNMLSPLPQSVPESNTLPSSNETIGKTIHWENWHVNLLPNNFITIN